MIKPYFLISLFLLILNDWILKLNFHNALTGKLSDFTGLYCFTAFFLLIAPKFRKLICFLIAGVFLFWKSAYSDGAINFFSFYFYQIQRTVDYSDYLALPVILFAYEHSLEPLYLEAKSVFNLSILAISLFAFSATSMPPNLTKDQQMYYDNLEKTWPTKYEVLNLVDSQLRISLPIPIEELKLRLEGRGYRLGTTQHKNTSLGYYVGIINPVVGCIPSSARLSRGGTYSEKDIKEIKALNYANSPVLIRATFSIEENQSNSQILLKDLTFCVKNEQTGSLKPEGAVELFKDLILP